MKHDKQRGVALIVSLLVLLVLTLIGVTGIVVSVLEERMSGNQRDRNLAFSAAESALKAAELSLDATFAAEALPTFNCSTKNGATKCPLIEDVSEKSVWSNSDLVTEYVGDLSNSSKVQLKEPPKYMIELLPLDGNSVGASGMAVSGDGQKISYGNFCYFRITARGVGANSFTVAIVQSIYLVPEFKSGSTGVCHG